MTASEAILGKNTVLKRGDGGVGAGTVGYVEWGSGNAKIRIKRKVAGTAGNGKNVTVAVSGASYVKTTLTANEISITAPTTATVAQVIAYLYTDTTFQESWDADYGATPGDGSGTITARTVTPTAGGTNGTEVFTTIAFVTDIGGPGRARELVDVTHYESPDDYREHMPTLKDGQEVTLELQWVPDNATQSVLFDDLEDGVKSNYQMYFAGEHGQSFAAYVTNIDHVTPLDDIMKLNVTFKISGPITDIA